MGKIDPYQGKTTWLLYDRLMISAKTKTLLAKYDYAVPRYTSFPTAVQFYALNNDASLHKQALNALNSHEPLSLYVHIPFCHSLCHYCGCNTKIVSTYAPVSHYIKTLLKEIDLVGAMLDKRMDVSRIHFGGGSPNFAHPDDLEKIIARFDHYFNITAKTQIDMECDPRLLSAEKISAYKSLGLSRVSLGIQDFDTRVQRTINRLQPFDTVKRHMVTFRENGITDINFDLITGLPRQTIATVDQTLSQLLELSPSRVAVFPYAHVPWMKKHQKLLEQYERPDTHARFEMSALVQTTLTQNGYNEIGIDHYALKNDPLSRAQQNKTMRRNFQGYTDDPASTIIGFGLSSISQFDGAYIQNTTDAPTYRKSIENGTLPLARGFELSPEDKKRRALIEELMCYFYIDLEEYKDIVPQYDALEALKKDGIITLKDNKIQITKTGKPFARIVASYFDPYFNQESGRHAHAV